MWTTNQFSDDKKMDSMQNEENLRPNTFANTSDRFFIFVIEDESHIAKTFYIYLDWENHMKAICTS